MSGDGRRPAVHFMEGDAQHHRQPNAVLRETSQSGDTLSNINSRQPSRSKFHTPTSATGPMTLMIGACCALMWTIVILVGLAVLIIYLVFRPKSPRLDIQSATLNGAYLDTGTLLNADITILANFSNPNRKVDVAFSYVQMDLYFMETMIATQAVEPFTAQELAHGGEQGGAAAGGGEGVATGDGGGGDGTRGGGEVQDAVGLRQVGALHLLALRPVQHRYWCAAQWSAAIQPMLNETLVQPN